MTAAPDDPPRPRPVYPRAAAHAPVSAEPDEAVPASPSFPAVEEAVLAYWDADGTFEASVARNPKGVDGANEFVFYDGPPFANGLPHYGHLLTGYVKDVVPRYQTMRGRHVERRFGWDCHGLPAEVEAERQLGIGHKAEIEAMGVAAFNDACRASVLRYTQEWRDYVSRQARWVDFDNDYRTLDLDYMESVMWAFRTLWDKGLIYEGFRVLAYCWRCETPLSNTETRMDDVYRPRADPAVTVRFRLETGEWALAWTTTPWTLPSNLAVAVGPDISYAVVEKAGERYLIAADRLEAYADELGEQAGGTVVGSVSGAELVGRSYTPLFDYLTDTDRFGTQEAFRVLAGDFVTTDEGTGIVHMAPAYGEDDQAACAAAGIPVVLTVDDQARFTDVVPDFAGQQVFEANGPIIDALRASGALVRAETYEHSYPHCWRCDTPLIYKAVSSWFVAVTKVRDRMVELNQQITWVPGHVRDGSFGKWLAGARDWSISRNRYWGSPIPVWRSDDPAYPRVDVYGSLDELERDFGVRPDDLHRPVIDELVRPNPDDPTGRSMMRRVPEVLDCWFESGSMPFAQVHYPFENADWFEHHYPGDFIVEYIGQTRGWFYTLHVLATALFDSPAFSTCVVHGIVLGSDGRKMSKSLRNYPDVSAVFARYGADAMRWFLMSSPVVRGGDLIVTEAAIRDTVRQVLMPVWNVWHFFALYANAAGGPTGPAYEARWRTDSGDVLDRYILAKTHALVVDVTRELDGYDIAGAALSVRDFLESLTNWYVRRARARFWSGEEEAFDTLYTVLTTLTRVLAPLLPMVSEEIYRGLTGERSVHLTDWPSPDELPADDALVATMDAVREVASTALGVRRAAGVRVRMPLARLTVAVADPQRLAPFAQLLSGEVNVKEVVLTDAATAGPGVQQLLRINPRQAGPRLGKDVQAVIQAARAGDWEIGSDGVVRAGGIPLREGEYEVETTVSGGATGVASAPLSGGGFITLDTTLTAELAAEGLARDVIRAVAQARRDLGLAVWDRIRLGVDGDDAALRAVSAHRELIAAETLADEVFLGGLPSERTVDVEVGDGLAVRLMVERVP